MLSTKNVVSTTSSDSVSVKLKNLRPGNIKARITDISLLDGYNKGSYHLILNIESEPVGEGFEGFFIDRNDESKGRFLGRTGRVRYSQYAFEDKTFSDGNSVKRDDGMLEALSKLAKALGVSAEIDEIECDNIEDFVAQAKAILVNNTYIYFCLGGKEYMKGEYINYDLFLPRPKNKRLPFTENVEEVMIFDEKENIIVYIPKVVPEVDTFSGTSNQDSTKSFGF